MPCMVLRSMTEIEIYSKGESDGPAFALGNTRGNKYTLFRVATSLVHWLERFTVLCCEEPSMWDDF